MPDEHQIEASEPQPSAPPEERAPTGESGPPEEPAPPNDAAAEREPSPEPHGTSPDAGDGSDADRGGVAGGDVVGDEVAADERAEVAADADSIGAELEEAVRQRDALTDRLLRATAEFDNYRKRTERERREVIEQAAGDLLGDLLPVVDDLERALAADTRDADAYRRGVEIIHRQLLDVMARRGVAPIEAVGADFDPTLHQAVAHEPSENRRDGEVVEELRRGYTLRRRLLRPSMVKVAKA